MTDDETVIQDAFAETIGWFVYPTHFYEIVLRARWIALKDVDKQCKEGIRHHEKQEDVVSIQPLFRSQARKASVEQ